MNPLLPAVPGVSLAGIRFCIPLSLLLVVPFAHAGWNSNPVTISPTTLSIPRVAACNDGAFGTFVAWQEESAPGQGVVRVQHVAPTGDVDPTWPSSGAIACSRVFARTTLGIIADGLGGAYVWWLEDRSFYLTRIDPTGAIATGWPALARRLGTTASTGHISVIRDGVEGIYAAWVAENGLSGDPFSISAMHLGPSNTGAGGWPNGVRGVTTATAVSTLEAWPKLALAPDGGIFVGWVVGSSDTEGEPHGFRLTRRTSAGLPASGWPASAISMGSFDYDGYVSAAGPTWHRAPLVDVAPDGRGGVFMVLADFAGGQVSVQPRLLRLVGDGSSAPDWPAEGRWHSPYPLSMAMETDGGFRVVGDGGDGAIVGNPLVVGHGPPSMQFRHVSATGDFSNMSGVVPWGTEVVDGPADGFYLASYGPAVTSGPYAEHAYLDVRSAPVTETLLFEFHDEPPLSNWYGDIALAPSGDGGAVFFWSQSNERIGLFARRFGPNGETVAVPAPMGRLALHSVRFVPGRGFVAAIDLPGDVAGRLEIFDVLGRRVDDVRLSPSAGGTREVALRTRVASGLYFARLSAAGQAVSRKVLRLDR